MNLDRTVAVLRHNTHLHGDLTLALREFSKLVGAEGARLATRHALVEALGGLRIGGIPQLSSNKSFVAVMWHGAPSGDIANLLARSAFAQEVFVLDQNVAALDEFQKTRPASVVCQELSGKALVALATGYVIESEGVLSDHRRQGRVRQTIELLLQPYVSSHHSTDSARLRKAKKTTLALSHDLHIYKAKFFPRMIRALLNIYGSTGQQVLDPYCGSGTSLLEGALLGFDTIGVDIDPICQLISKSKLTPFLQGGPIGASLDEFEAALDARQRGTSSKFIFPEELTKKLARRDKIDGTNYLAEIQAEAAQLAYAISTLKGSGPARDLISVIASDSVTKKIRYRFIGVGNGKYTIEIVKQRLLARVREKIERCRQLENVFVELATELGVTYGKVAVADGDARIAASWPAESGSLVVTSPPYLPASSGREHYAASRALAFAVLGYEPGRWGYFDSNCMPSPEDDLSRFSEAQSLMTYLESDASAEADPQRDAMRFERKAQPTRQYLQDIQKFFKSAQQKLDGIGLLLLVVAHHHTFYSHRRSELEHIVSCGKLYSELAQAAGLTASEEIAMELLKSAVSRARPRAKDDYFESILVLRPSQARSVEQDSHVLEVPVH